MSIRRRPQQSHGFPLASLFLLMTLFAVLIAHLSPLATAKVGNDISPSTVLFSPVAGMVLGACFGSIIGSYHFQRRRGVLIGFVTGVALGVICGPICVISFSLPWHMVLISTGSSVVLLTLSVVYWYVNNPDPVSRRDVFEKMFPPRREDTTEDLPSRDG